MASEVGHVSVPGTLSPSHGPKGPKISPVKASTDENVAGPATAPAVAGAGASDASDSEDEDEDEGMLPGQELGPGQLSPTHADRRYHSKMAQQAAEHKRQLQENFHRQRALALQQQQAERDGEGSDEEDDEGILWSPSRFDASTAQAGGGASSGVFHQQLQEAVSDHARDANRLADTLKSEKQRQGELLRERLRSGGEGLSSRGGFATASRGGMASAGLSMTPLGGRASPFPYDISAITGGGLDGARHEFPKSRGQRNPEDDNARALWMKKEWTEAQQDRAAAVQAVEEEKKRQSEAIRAKAESRRRMRRESSSRAAGNEEAPSSYIRAASPAAGATPKSGATAGPQAVASAQASSSTVKSAGVSSGVAMGAAKAASSPPSPAPAPLLVASSPPAMLPSRHKPPSPGPTPPDSTVGPNVRADANSTEGYLSGMTIEAFVNSHGLDRYMLHFTDVADTLEDLVEGLRGREFQDFVEQAEMEENDASRLRSVLDALQ